MLVCIVGPTASGKTALSIALAKAIGGEILSADSVQLYRNFDIGSAKPSKTEMQGVPHHLMDCIDATEGTFSVGRYQELAMDALRDIQARRHRPILCGGSGLYVDALIRPLNFALPSNPAVREQLCVLYPQSEPQAAYDALKRIDPQTAARLHPNDRKRVIRALEVYEISRKPLSSYGNGFREGSGNALVQDALVFRLTMDRALLYRRIEHRVDEMIRSGLVEEVKRLRALGYGRELIPMQALGYQQVNAFLDGACTLDEAVARIKLETRHFAKRQISWFKRYENAIDLHIDENTTPGDLLPRMQEAILKYQ